MKYIHIKISIKIFAALLLVVNLRANAAVIEVSVQPPGLFESNATVRVKNNSPVPRIVRISVSNNSDRKAFIGSTILVVPELSAVEKSIKPNSNMRFDSPLYWEWGEGIGDLEKSTEERGYWIPFEKGVKTLICQYPHGNAPAIDFCAPIRTRVTAAKAGTVFRVVDHFTEGGSDPKFANSANVIEIYQNDGTRAFYAHFDPKSATVKEGEKVDRGQVLASVGLTGQTSGPHLHFHVTRYDSELRDSFIDPKFENERSEPIEIKSGYTVDRDTFKSNLGEKKIVEQDRASSNVNIETKVNKEPSGIECGTNQVEMGKKAIDCIGKNKEKAVEYFNIHLKTSPNDGLALARLATLYTGMNRHVEALPVYKKALAANWISYDFAYHYSTSLFESGMNKEGMKWIRRSVELAPSCASCLGGLARRLTDEKKYKEALSILEAFDARQQKAGKNKLFTGQIMLIRDQMEN